MKKASTSQIAFASFIGTAIEFYDFYIYAMASALVIGQVFFPASDPAVQTLNAFLTFGLAFIQGHSVPSCLVILAIRLDVKQPLQLLCW